MEALVNYSSEDEQDDLGYQKAAERGGSPTLRRPNSRGGGDSDTNANDRNTTGNGKSSSSRHNKNYAEETHTTNKHITTSSYRRSSSSYHSRDNDKDSSSRVDRDNRYKRDARDSRNLRDSRDYKSHDRRNTTKERHDYKRESEKYRDNRRDERSSHHHNRYSAPSSSSHYNNSSSNNSSSRHSNGKSERYSSSSSSNNTRDERSKHGDTSRRQKNRSRDEREERQRDGREDRSNRHERTRHSQRSRSRSRSRSRTPTRQSPPLQKERNERQIPQEPLEQARLSALEMERKLNTHLDDESLQQLHHQQQPKTITDHWNSPAAAESNPAVPVARRIEALLSLPLSDMPPKPNSIIAVTAPPPPLSAHLGSSAAATSMESEPAVIQLPSYYNPSVINPNKYVEQMQKRKLLWAKKSDDSATKWNHAQFSQDTDGKVASKFMRLMGIKSTGNASAPPEPEKVVPLPTPDVKSREAMFTNMEQQYEVARQATHTMRGVGLGFGSQTRPF